MHTWRATRPGEIAEEGSRCDVCGAYPSYNDDECPMRCLHGISVDQPCASCAAFIADGVDRVAPAITPGIVVDVKVYVEYEEVPLVDDNGARIGTRFYGRVIESDLPAALLAEVTHPPDAEPIELQLLRNHVAALKRRLEGAS